MFEPVIVKLPFTVRLTHDTEEGTVTVAPDAITTLLFAPCVGTTPPTQVEAEFQGPPAAVEVMVVWE
jgi:hypothetical protein